MRLLFTFCLTLLSFVSIAEHITGAHISYTQQGALDFTFQLEIIVDCDATDPVGGCVGVFDTICAYQAPITCGSSESPWLYITNNNGECYEFELLAGDLVSNESMPLFTGNQSECDGGSFQGFRKLTYQKAITLPLSHTPWEYFYSTFNRNSGLSNIAAPALNGISVRGFIHYSNDANHRNETPINDMPLVLWSPLGKKVYQHLNFTDPDGDSIAFEMIEPLIEDKSSTISWFGGTDKDNPLINGDLTWNTNGFEIEANEAQLSVFAFSLKEYRDTVLIGETQYDVHVASDTFEQDYELFIPGLNNAPVGQFRAQPDNSINLDIRVENAPGHDMTFDCPILPSFIDNVTELADGSYQLSLRYDGSAGPLNNGNLIPIRFTTQGHDYIIRDGLLLDGDLAFTPVVIANDDSIIMHDYSEVVIEILENDVFDGLTAFNIEIVLGGDKGTLTLDQNTLFYTPSQSFCGVDSVLYVIHFNGGTDSAYVLFDAIDYELEPTEVFFGDWNDDTLLDVSGFYRQLDSYVWSPSGLAFIDSNTIDVDNSDTLRYTLKQYAGIGCHEIEQIDSVIIFESYIVASVPEDDYVIITDTLTEGIAILDNDSLLGVEDTIIRITRQPRHGVAQIINNKITYTTDRRFCRDTLRYEVEFGTAIGSAWVYFDGEPYIPVPSDTLFGDVSAMDTLNYEHLIPPMTQSKQWSPQGLVDHFDRFITAEFSAPGFYTLSLVVGFGCHTDIQNHYARIIKTSSIETWNADLAQIMPNPFSTRLVVESQVDAELHVYNALGAKIHSGKLAQGREVIDTDTWPIGAYTIELVHEGSRYSQSIIKQ